MSFHYLAQMIFDSQAAMAQIEQELYANPINYREVFVAFAVELSKQPEGLTELERKQAIMNHVLESLEPKECAF